MAKIAGIETNLNPTAAMLLMKADRKDWIKNEDGTPISEELSKALDTAFTQFNRNRQLTGARAKESLSTVLEKVPLFNYVTVVFGDERTIPMDIYTGLSDTLTSTERLGRQLAASEKNPMPTILGKELYCRHMEQQYDLKDKWLSNHLYDPNFENRIHDTFDKAWANDLGKVAFQGTSDTFVVGNMLTLGIGFEKILSDSNGSWTNSNETSIVYGKFGNLVTPNKYNPGAASSAWTGYTIMTYLDALHNLMINNEQTAQYLTPDVVYMMSRRNANLYAKVQSATVDSVGGYGVNTSEREQMLRSGIIPAWRGIPIVIMDQMSNDKIILGDPRNFQVGILTEIDITREREPRLTTGGKGIEVTKTYYVDFDILNKEAVAVAYNGAKVETPTFWDGTTAESSQITSGTTSVDVYAYCDTKDAQIVYYTSTLAGAATYAAAIAAGATAFTADTAATLTTDTYYIRAYKDDYLTGSTEVTFVVS